MKFITCSVCNSIVKANKTTIIDHKRVCHDCKKKASKKEKEFFLVLK
jgi:formylmethanofuran dehydrogenase subunit E